MHFLICIDYMERAHFFEIIGKVLLKQKNEVYFLTYRFTPYEYLKKKFRANRVFIVNKFYKEANEYIDKFFLASPEFEDLVMMDVSAGWLKRSYAEKKTRHLVSIFQLILEKYKINEVFIWNGSRLFERTMRYVCEKNNIDTYFFEIANFKGKIFIDKKGVNYESTLTNLSIEEVKTKVTKHTIEKYKEYSNKYKESEEFQHVTPQAKRKRPNFNILIDYIYWLSHPYSSFKDVGFNIAQNLNKFSRYIRNTDFFKYSSVDPRSLSSKYYFLPLQVTKDSQIIRNSQYQNMYEVVIEVINRLYKDEYLLIKPHPAEREHNKSVHKLNLLQSDRIKFVNENTFKLIKYSKGVITVNSTVGLEALLYHKPVFVLGKAFYSNKEVTYDCLGNTNRFRDMARAKKISPLNIDSFMAYYISNSTFNMDYFKPDIKNAEDILKKLNISRKIEETKCFH